MAMAEVAKRNSINDCWVVIESAMYSCHPWLPLYSKTVQ